MRARANAGRHAMFEGSLTALITPFADGAVDEKRYQDFVAWQIDEGTQGVVPVGSTGETPTLSHEEHRRVVQLCIEVAKGRVPVLAGASSNATAEAVSLARFAQSAGADGVMAACPYYNKPTQEGLYRHFEALHDSVDIPVVIYNVPGRSAIDMSVATMARLAQLPRIVGVKDATADLARPLRVRTEIGADFLQLSGEDATVAAFLAQGGHGCISVTANVAPRLCAELHAAWRAGDLATMATVRDKLGPLHDALFVETNPGPVKHGLSLLGKCADELRLPLVPVTAPTRAVVRAAMVHAGLLN